MSDPLFGPDNGSDLVGKFCLISIGEEETDHWQGQVVSYFAAGFDQGHIVRVQLFSFFTGNPTDQVLLRVSDLVTSPGKYACRFYEDEDDFKTAFEKLQRKLLAREANN